MRFWEEHGSTIQRMAAGATDLPEVKAAYQSPVRVDITNVARYWFRDLPVTEPRKAHLPNVTPPWPAAWYEWAAPSFVNEHGKVLTCPREVERCGVLLFSERFPGGEYPYEWAVILDYWQSMRQGKRRWVFRGPAAICAVTDQGGLYEDIYIALPPGTDAEGQYAAFWQRNLLGLVAPVLLAHSFIHCRNVEIVTDRPPAKVARKREKQDKHALVYKTLKIAPVKRRALREDSEASGEKLRLHICRGHFKDYRDGKGLFGRYNGLFWWDMHVRGSSEMGEVRKDYEI